MKRRTELDQAGMDGAIAHRTSTPEDNTQGVAVVLPVQTLRSKPR